MSAPKVPEMSVERLRDLLRYDPETGVFTWLVRSARSIRVGDVAGSVQDNGNVKIRIDGRAHYAHRLAVVMMTGRWPSGEVDRRNGNLADARWVNLRDATRKQSHECRGGQISSVSSARGVSWSKASEKWEATIGHNNRTIHLGKFHDLTDAVAARIRAERKLFTHHREVC